MTFLLIGALIDAFFGATAAFNRSTQPDFNLDAADIERAYRKLISQKHPDKLASRGLSESMRSVGEERSRELNSACDLIKTARSDLK